jgi:hypothetical protein
VGGTNKQRKKKESKRQTTKKKIERDRKIKERDNETEK